MFKKIQTPSGQNLSSLSVAEPLAERIQKKAKLIVIDDEKNQVRLISMILSRVCQVPPGLPPVRSFDQAAILVETHSPDIVISDKGFGRAGDHFKVLHFTKSRNNNSKVILFTGDPDKDDRRPINGFFFDQILQKASLSNDEIIQLVSRFII